MREDLFQELVESVREGGAILRGQKRASRRFECADNYHHTLATQQHQVRVGVVFYGDCVEDEIETVHRRCHGFLIG